VALQLLAALEEPRGEIYGKVVCGGSLGFKALEGIALKPH
jgi:hypothetical protein